MNRPTLSRPRQGRIIAGVCAGLARRFGWNVTLVRVLAVLSFLLPGSQLVIYAICWIAIPSDPDVVQSPFPGSPQEPSSTTA